MRELDKYQEINVTLPSYGDFLIPRLKENPEARFTFWFVLDFAPPHTTKRSLDLPGKKSPPSLQSASQVLAIHIDLRCK